MTEAKPAVQAVIDARGLDCPMPLVKLRQAFMVLEAGATVRLLATDPQALDDVTEFCFAGDHELVDARREGALLSLLVKKAG